MPQQLGQLLSHYPKNDSSNPLNFRLLYSAYRFTVIQRKNIQTLIYPGIFQNVQCILTIFLLRMFSLKSIFA